MLKKNKTLGSLEEFQKLIIKLDGNVGFVGFLIFDDGIYEYARLLSADILDAFANKESIRKFYTDDLGYAFAQVLKERSDANTETIQAGETGRTVVRGLEDGD